MTSTPSAALIVLNWNGRDLLETCLPALAAVDYPNAHIIVVDNASTDDSVAYVQAHFPAVTILVNDDNLGFGPGMNVGLQHALDAGFDFIVSVNNDVVVRPEWLTHILQPFQEDASIGVVGCKLLFPDGRLQHVGAEITYPLAYSRHFHHLEEDSGQADALQDMDYITGASMALRRSMLEEIGLFDPLFAPFYYEEVDLCYRARAAGYRVVYTPAAVATHHESASMEKVSANRMPNFHLSRLKFAFKHYTLDQILNDFGPAERERLHTADTHLELRVTQRVYLHMATILGQIGRPPGDVRAIEALLHDLRKTAQDLQFERYAYQPQPGLLAPLHTHHKLREHTFESDAPVVGSLVASFREQWNNVSTKWYVETLREQQETFNTLVTQIINQLLDNLDQVARGQGEQAAANLDNFTTLAEEIAQLTQQMNTQTAAVHSAMAALNARLDQLEARLDRLDNR